MSYIRKFHLHGKNAIITGGAGFLGQHISAGLAESGANVAIIDINKDKATECATKLQKEYGVKSIGINCDITLKDSVTEMIDIVKRELGDINILHNNAAWKSDDLDSFFATFEDFSLETWRNVMEVNIDGMFLVAQSVANQMIQQGKGGSIIQTSSIYGIMGPDERIYEGSYYLGREISTPAVYSASKAAVIGLTKHMATHLAKYNIRVNAITPGGVESGQNETFKEKYSNRIPLKRMAKAEEMVGGVIYLASDASSYVTGQNIIIDGGLSAW